MESSIHMFLLLSLGICANLASTIEINQEDSRCPSTPEALDESDDLSSMLQMDVNAPNRPVVASAAAQLERETATGSAVEAPAALPTAHEHGHLHWSLLATQMAYYIEERQLGIGILVLVVGIVPVLCKMFFPNSTALTGICCGVFYIMISAAMIETNKWLMMPNHFPYPLALTMNHMTVSFLCCCILLRCCPSAFPSLEKVEVDWSFCSKFLPIGAAFALSIVCGNAAYEYLSVSFLQIMKQSNIVTIYVMSAIFGLERVRKCNVLILFGVLTGSTMGVRGELHFQAVGFFLQVISSLSEAGKVITQSILMSGTTKLDPLTMVLFMAPACLAANFVPFVAFEGVHYRQILAHAYSVAPVLILNAMMAFALNLSVAVCIKKLSAVGYLLCGVVKDVCIITSSAYLLGDALSIQQKVGFCLALVGVFCYSMYKQNQDCFENDDIIGGFRRVASKLGGYPAPEATQATAKDEIVTTVDTVPDAKKA